MLNAYLGTRRRLSALAGLFVTMALTAVPTAFAVPLMPDGEPVPRGTDSELYPGEIPNVVPGPVDSAPVVHASSSGLDWAQVGLVVAVGLIAALSIATAAFVLTGRRRLRLAAR